MYSIGETKIIDKLLSQFFELTLMSQAWILQAFWDLLIPGTQASTARKSEVLGGRPPRIGGVMHLERFHNTKTVAIGTLGPTQFSFHPFVIIPENVFVAPQEGRRLMELYYSQKVYDFALGQGVPEVETLVAQVVRRVLIKAKLLKNHSGIPQGCNHENFESHNIEIVQMIGNEGCRHASTISTRFESDAVRKTVDIQYYSEFCKWMFPEAYSQSEK